MADPHELSDPAEEFLRAAHIAPENPMASNGSQSTSAFLAEEIKDLCARVNGDGAFIAFRDPRGFYCVASWGAAPASGSRLHLNAKLTKEFLATSQAVVWEEVESGWGEGLLLAGGLRRASVVAVPIRTRGVNVGVIQVCSSRISAFYSTIVAELQTAADFLSADPRVFADPRIAQIVDLEATTSVAGAVRGPQQSIGSSALVVSRATESLSAGPSAAQRRDQKSFTAHASQTVAPSAANFALATIERKWEQASYLAEKKDKKVVAKAWLSAVAALVFLALLFWFGSSRHRAPIVSSNPMIPSPSSAPGNREETTRNQDALRPNKGSGQFSEPRQLPSAAPSGVEERKSAPKQPEAPVEGSSSLAASDRATSSPGDSKPAEAPSDEAIVSNTKPSAPPVEATKIEPPVEPPVESTNASIPPSTLPAAIKSAEVSRPDFVLDHSLKGHSGWVTGVAFSADGRRLASGSWDETLKFWDVPTGEKLNTVGNKIKEVQAVALSRDGRWLASENSSDTVTLWDATTGAEIRTLPSDKPLGTPGSNWVYSIAFSPDGRWLASGVDDKTVRLWDVTTGRTVRDLTGPRRSVMYAAFSPDGHWLASGEGDKDIRIWDASTGQQVRLLTGHKKVIYAVVFSPDGRWLASASADKTIKLWDVAAGREVHTLTGHGNIVTSLAFSPDGRWLASGSWDKTVKIWDVETGLEVQSLSGPNQSIYSVAFDSSGRWLASGSEDGKINLWRSSRTADQTTTR